MKNLKISLILLLTLISTLVYSAPKKVDPWKYEPTRSGNTDLLDIIAERTVQTSILDQVVDATNLENIIEETERRKTTVNASTQASKKAMGNTMMKRIFKNTAKGGLWGTLGVTAVQELLEGIDWVIDPNSQSIWRNKQPENPSYVCKNFGFTWKNELGNPHKCPQEAALDFIKTKCTGSLSNCTLVKMSSNSSFTNDVGELPNNAPISSIFVRYSATWSGSLNYFTTTLEQYQKLDVPDPQREIMTDEHLADYMLGKAKDSPNPNKHTSVNEIFKPANEYEYNNNPAVQIAKQSIENAPKIQDEKDTNTDINTKPDGSGFELPKFCTWAKYVCDWVDWTKEEPEKEQEPERPEIDEKGIFSRTFDTVFSLSKQCPPDVPFALETQYLKGNFKISLNWLCLIFTFLGYPLQLIAHLTGLWILYETVVRKEIKW